MPADVQGYTRLLRYDAWANGQTLASLRDGGAPPAKAVRWMAHIVGSGEIWHARLLGETPPLPVWPELDLDGCAAGVARLGERWTRYLERLAPEDLNRTVSYRNSRGEDWSSTAGDILTHVTIHGAYHRAQIAAEVREGGGQPAYTDFIQAARLGLLE